MIKYGIKDIVDCYKGTTQIGSAMYNGRLIECEVPLTFYKVGIIEPNTIARFSGGPMKYTPDGGVTWYLLQPGVDNVLPVTIGTAEVMLQEYTVGTITHCPDPMVSDTVYGGSGLLSTKDMFRDRDAGAVNIEYLDTSNVTNMSFMFAGTLQDNGQLFNFDTANVTDFSYMFQLVEFTTLDLSGFDTSNAIILDRMFDESKVVTVDISSFRTSNVVSLGGMFRFCFDLLALDLSAWDTSNVTDMSAFLLDTDSLATLDVTSFTGDSLITMPGAFSGTAVTLLDLPNFNTPVLVNMRAAFGQNLSMTDINIPLVTTDKVNDFSRVFEFNSALTNIDLSTWRFNTVEFMYEMFRECTVLTCITHLNTRNTSNRQDLFKDCIALVQPDGWNADPLLYTGACADLTSVDGDNWANVNQCGDYIPVLTAPSIVTDFQASDDAINLVTVTFTDPIGIPGPNTDLYSGANLIASDIVSGHQHAYVGTRDYHIKAVNSEGSTDSNIDSGTGLPPIPGDITDFAASDAINGVIECTWSDSTYAATYDLYSGDVLLATDIVSGHLYTYVGKIDLHVRATNVTGFTNSNIDEGIGMPTEVPDVVVNFSATDSETEEIIMTWSPAYGAFSYDLYEGTTLLATDITSPFSYPTTGTSTYHVKAINNIGVTDSNEDQGTGLIGQPGTITDFDATDGFTLQVVLTWSPAQWAESYDIYKDGVLFATDVVSGYTDSPFSGTAFYRVYAHNKGLTTVGSGDNGTAVNGPHFVADITTNTMVGDTVVEDVNATGTGFQYSLNGGTTWLTQLATTFQFPADASILIRKLDGAMNFMFGDTQSHELTSITNISAFGSTSCETMFIESEITTIDLSGFDTTDVVSTKGMFLNSALVTDIILTNNTYPNCVDYFGMFQGATGLTHLDLRFMRFNTPADMDQLFSNTLLVCISNVNTTNALSVVNMFSGTSLTKPDVAEQAAITGVGGLDWVNDWPDCPNEPEAPVAIVDFSATEHLTQQVQVTWTASVGASSYDLYSGVTLLASDISSGYVDTYTGTRDYHVNAVGVGGETNSNVDSGTGLLPGPGTITDFNASDDENNQVTCTWSDADYATSYDVYRSSALLASGVTSPYVDTPYEGTATYKVHAINSEGETVSNTDSGSGGRAPSAIINFTATDNEVGQVTCTWSSASGDPIPTYDLYTDNTLIASGVESGYIDSFTGTRAYHVKAINIHDSTNSNVDSGTGTPPPPSTIVDFDASDDGVLGIVTCTWSPASGAVSYNLYRNNSLAEENVTSPHDHNFTGTSAFRVRAINTGGYADSNTDDGTATAPPEAPGVITNFNATDDEVGEVTCTWSNATGNPLPTYDLYSGITLLASGVTTFYDDSYEGTRDYHVKAVNSEGSTDSNTDSGTGLGAPGDIVDFNATDTEVEQITLTWSDATGTPTPTYNVHRNGLLLAEDVTSPYVDNGVGTVDYYVRAINSVGTSQSNTDSGTALQGLEFEATLLPARARCLPTGGDMNYSNDGGSTWVTILDGVADQYLEVGTGPYILREAVYSSVTSISFPDTQHVALTGDLVVKGGDALVSTTYWFANMGVDLNSLDITTLDTSNVTDMSFMFADFNAGVNVPLHNLSTASAVDLSNMFRDNDMSTTAFPVDFGIVAEDMSSMFYATTGATVDLSNFASSSALTTVAVMFADSVSLTTIRMPSNGFAGVSDFSDMFNNCGALGCFTNIDTTNATDTTNMFIGCTSLVRPDATDQTDIADILSGGAIWVNDINCGDYTPIIPPSAITDLVATDDEKQQVTITWTLSDGGPTPSHALYGGGILLDDNASSPYVESYVGTKDYYVVATNSEGTETSNVDSGTGLPVIPPLPITDLDASDTQPSQVTITWTNATEGFNVQQDIYAGGVLLDSDIDSPYVDTFIGTRDYYVIVVNDDGTETSNTDSGTGAPALTMPSAIVDFVASDTELGQVTVTFSDATGNPTPVHDLYTGTTQLKTSISSGYVDSYEGTRDYHVKAINSQGIVDSNIDDGTGTKAPSVIIDFNATDDVDSKIVCTWSDAVGIPNVITYDLYEGAALTAADITSPYDYVFVGQADLHIRATNSAGGSTSNVDTGKGVLPMPLPIEDFDATDTQDNQVTCTWSIADGITYDLYRAGGLISSDVTSGYVDVFTGTADYYVKGTNASGFVDSNVDSGTGVVPLAIPSAIVDFAATSNQLGYVEVTWTNAVGNPTPTHDLYSGLTLLASNVSTGYIDPYEGTRDYHVKAINSEGSVDSNIDSGTGLDAPAKTTLTWTEQSGTANLTMEGGKMEYSNDGGENWTVFDIGINIPLPSGIGSYILREQIGNTVTWVTLNQGGTNPIGGDMVATGGYGLTSTDIMFRSLRKITSLDLSAFHTTSVSDMGGMFSWCTGLTSLDISNLYTNKVTKMDHMFDSCTGLTSLDVSGLYVGKVTDMGDMFAGCTSIQELDLSTWDTSKVVSMSNMFRNMDSMTGHFDVSSFTGEALTSTSTMFSELENVTSIDITNMDTSKVDQLHSMFSHCTSLVCISNIDSSNEAGTVVTRASMFEDCPALLQPDAAAQADIIGEDGAVWVNAEACPPPVEVLLEITWESMSSTSYVGITGASMDYSKDGGNSWSVITAGVNKQLTTGSGPYILKEQSYGAVTGIKFYYGGNTVYYAGHMTMTGGNLTTCYDLFRGVTSITSLDVSALNTSSVTDLTQAFYNVDGLTYIDISNWDISSVTKVGGMFRDSINLTGISMPTGVTSKVTAATSVFNNTKIGGGILDMSWLDLGTGCSTDSMFRTCDVQSIIFREGFLANTDVDAMFHYATDLQCISNLDTTSVNWVSKTDMFNNNTSLTQPDAAAQSALSGGYGSNWVNANPCP